MPPPIRAILWDVGGPIDLEVQHEALWNDHLRGALALEGIAVSSDDLEAASERAVACFAPNAYAAIIWDLAGHDPAIAARVTAYTESRSAERSERRGGLEIRPGIPELLRDLHSRGLLLGLAANQPLRALHDLDALGIGQYFTHRELTGHHGFRKPDVRLFLRACEDLGVDPTECLMVGDRIDNDVAPAKWLGMRAVLLRTGRHRNQQPRSREEVPDAEADTVETLASAINAMLLD